MLACIILVLYLQASFYVGNAESNWILPAESDWILPAESDSANRIMGSIGFFPGKIGLTFVAQVGLISV